MKRLSNNRASSAVHVPDPHVVKAAVPIDAGGKLSTTSGKGKPNDGGAYSTAVGAHGTPRQDKQSVEHVDEMWHPQQLVVYSDAGFGGVGTRAQTGVLVLWAGSPVLARSSRQSVSALSTCESEVCAASTAWICTEGLVCLLEEWHIDLRPPILLRR